MYPPPKKKGGGEETLDLKALVFWGLGCCLFVNFSSVF